MIQTHKINMDKMHIFYLMKVDHVIINTIIAQIILQIIVIKQII